MTNGKLEMSDVQLSLSEKNAKINGVVIPRQVFNLLMKNERLLAINLYRRMKKVHLSDAVDTINPIYEAITE